MTFADHCDDGIAQFRNAIAMEPDFVMAHLYLVRAYRDRGLFDPAIEESRNLIASGNPLGEYALAASFAASGKKNEALEILSGLIARFEQTHSGSFQIASIYGCLKDRGNTMRWLEEAYKQREQQMPFLKLPAEFKYLHDDPDFQNLVRRIGIPSS